MINVLGWFLCGALVATPRTKRLGAWLTLVTLVVVYPAARDVVGPDAFADLTTTALDNLLHSAHLVDGIVKGLKVPDWPTDGWQALQRLAFSLCRECAPSPSPSGGGRG